MKWKTKTKTVIPEPIYYRGHTVIVKAFAFRPTKCNDGYTYWLTWINVKLQATRTTYYNKVFAGDWKTIEYMPYIRKLSEAK